MYGDGEGDFKLRGTTPVGSRAERAPRNELRWNRAGSRHLVFLKPTVPSKLA